jgi:drug/metabolite transporter (DMT)-like permease
MDYPASLGLLLGVIVGGTYAALQLAALRKNERRQQQEQQSPKVTAMLPGSMVRVALLLVALVLVQVFVPEEYKKNPRFYWCLAIGVVVAYSVPFFWRLKDMISRR